MREIKFRGLSKRTGEFVYGSYIETNIDAPAIVFGDGEQEEIIPISRGQYSGVNDKNKTNIFERDVVVLRAAWGGFQGVVEFDNGYFGIRDGKFLYDFNHTSGAALKVIGNVDQNPELLGDKNDCR